MFGLSLRQQQLKHPGRLSLALTVLAVWILLVEACADRQLVINTSSSVPPGIYRRSSSEPVVGSIVDFCIPAAASSYIAGRSEFAGRDWYILKPIVAGPGDLVDTLGESLWINGKYEAPISTKDAVGRRLPRWRAHHVLMKGEFFVFSARIPNSFDSRYYGPIRREQIKAVRIPLVTW